MKNLRLTTLALALASVAFSSTTSAQIEVSQESAPGAGDFDLNVLGTIDAVPTSQTIQNYYGFNSASGSFNGPEPVPDADTVFLALIDSSANGMNLILLYGEANASFTGSVYIDSRVVVAEDPDGAEFRVYDGLPNQGTHIDEYTTAGKSYFGINHGYGPCCTDGMALGALDGDWVVYYELVSATGPVPANLMAHTSGGGGVALDLAVGKRVRLRPLTSEPTRVPYCFADVTSQACPCANQDDSYNGGCVNSTGAGGVLLAEGTTSVMNDDLSMRGIRLPADQFAIVFHGPSQASIPFASGLRCVSGALVRYPVQTISASGDFEQLGVAGLGGAVAGQSLNYQCWYRDPLGSCGATFGFTNAVSVTFVP